MRISDSMTETFTFASKDGFYIHFYRYPTEEFYEFIRFLSSELGVEMGEIRDLVFAKSSAFNFSGERYIAVAGQMDSCHVVAPNETARIRLLEKLFGPNLDWEVHRSPM